MKQPLKTRALRLAATSIVASTAILVLHGYTGGPVTGGGSIRVNVRMDGRAPALAAHKATRSPEVCGQTVPNEEIVTGAAGALANAIVWIDGIQKGRPIQARPITLDQRGCRFTPRVISASAGTPLVLTSSDATLHTTHVVAGERTIFNVALPAKGMRVTKRLERPGALRVKCEAGHTWMTGWIRVFDHPYHGVTGQDGRVTLAEVPAGHHVIKVWHERLGEQSAQLDVAAGAEATAEVRFRAR